MISESTSSFAQALTFVSLNVLISKGLSTNVESEDDVEWVYPSTIVFALEFGLKYSFIFCPWLRIESKMVDFCY